MRLPTYEELAKEEEQLDVLEHPLDQSLFVVGPPGSGKTVLAIQRAQMVKEAMGSVSVITYNRMLRRLLALLGEVTDASTFHCFVSKDVYDRTRKSVPKEPRDPYKYLWTDIFIVLDEIGAGPNRKHLLVDEGQDLPEGFYRYASQYVAKTMTVFADEDQALSGECTTLEQIKTVAGLADPIILKKNHRNSPEVARLAEHFHSGRLPAAQCERSSTGELPRLVGFSTMKPTAKFISNRYKTQGGSIGIIVDKNDSARAIYRQLRELLPGKRIDIYMNERKNEDKINVLKDGVTVLNKKSVKGQEFDAVFILEIERFIPCRNDVERRAMYMMCARARDTLFLVHGPNALSREAEQSLPGPNILERS